MGINLLNLHIQFSVGVMIVLILRQWMKRLPKIYSYLLWLVVFARLLCPISLESEIALVPSVEMSAVQEISSDILKGNAGIETDVMKNFVETDSEYMEAEYEKTTTDGRYVKGAFLGLWVLVALCMISYNLAAVWSLKEKLRDAQCIEEGIYSSGEIAYPFTVGIRRPKIYLPVCLGREEQQYIICHERVHVRRKDYLVKEIAFLLAAVFWFNPLVWVAFYYLEQDMEMSCDETVLTEVGEGIRKQYSQSLLDFAVGKKSRAFTPLTFGEVSVKQRIKNILQHKAAKRWMSAMGAMVLIALALMLFTTKSAKEAWSQDQEEAAAFVESWAEAFIERDGEYLTAHMSDQVKEKYEKMGWLIIEEDYTSFGMSSPWPWGNLPWSVNLENTENPLEWTADIYYHAMLSNPHVFIWNERMTIQKVENDYVVAAEELEQFYSIETYEAFKRSYPRENINDTPMDYAQNDLGEILNANALENAENPYYKDLFNPLSAARTLLNLSTGEGAAKQSIVETKEDGSVVIEISFGDSKNTILIQMEKAFGEEGIWIPQDYIAGDALPESDI